MAARPAVVLEQPELLFPTGLNSRQRSPATAHKEARSWVKGGGFARYRRRFSEVCSDYCKDRSHSEIAFEIFERFLDLGE